MEERRAKHGKNRRAKSILVQRGHAIPLAASRTVDNNESHE
jgi:hypothetical protein